MREFDLDHIAYRLDRQMDHFKKRFKIADKRHDWLQDARQVEEDAHGESLRYEKLEHLCGRADSQVQELEWRLDTLKKAYNTLEEIEMSVDNIQRTNRIRREKKRKAETTN
jgi:hypothetical protein